MKIYLIVSASQLTPDQQTRIESLGEFKFIKAQKLSAQEVISKIPDAEILIAGGSGIEKISRELLKGLKKLKYITTLSVGFDWVDIEAAKQLNIQVSNVPGANSEAVAEHTWGMILDLGKRITEFNRGLIMHGTYEFPNYKGREVYGKTLGIIGLGNIGKKVARIAKGFDMRVIGANKSNQPVDGVELVTLDVLLKESDVIAVCVPFTPETNNMIDAPQINLMKDGVIVVNCSVYQTVNKEAIIKAVDSGKVFGYGIETEIMKPIPADDPYLSNPRILVTPHNAFNTAETEVKVMNGAISNVQSFLSGNPNNLVT